ncbi:MAG: glycoside hydrolase family 88 protein [Clostridia bacterium]|nr:glycoside hydrolase family 88 protein [Clostridia bacterium]
MNRGHINLEHPERFRGEYKISDKKIQKAIKNATDKLLSKIDIYTDGFPGTYAKDFKYPIGENNSWTCGMHTGTFVLAYELTGDERFLEVAKNHMNSYKKRLDENINLDDHDVGFIYSPSCVALYKVTGDKLAKENALRAAEHLYNESYSQKRRIYHSWCKFR